MKRRRFLSLMGTAALASGLLLTGCGGGEAADDRRIIRIGHVQSANHPDHLGLTAFADFINEKLGDKYRVEVYPSELLGSQTEMVQLLSLIHILGCARGGSGVLRADTCRMASSTANTSSCSL